MTILGIAALVYIIYLEYRIRFLEKLADIQHETLEANTVSIGIIQKIIQK